MPTSELCVHSTDEIHQREREGRGGERDIIPKRDISFILDQEDGDGKVSLIASPYQSSPLLILQRITELRGFLLTDGSL